MFLSLWWNFRWKHFSQFDQSAKFLHLPLFINFENINFHRWPNFKIFVGTIFCWWPLFMLKLKKKKELIYINQKWYHDKSNMIFVCIILLLYFSRDIYKNLFECQQHVNIHTCAQVHKFPYSHYGDYREGMLY